MSGPDFVDVQPPSLPIWLQGAIVAIKTAAGVEKLLGRDVDELRRQVCTFVRRPLSEDEDLPTDVYEQFLNCIAYNDALAKKKDKTTGEYLNRQSVRSLIGDGKWREAPKRRMEKASKSDTYAPPPGREEAERQALRARIDAERWLKDFLDMTRWGWTDDAAWQAHRDTEMEAFKQRILRQDTPLAQAMARVEAAPLAPTLSELAALMESL